MTKFIMVENKNKGRCLICRKSEKYMYHIIYDTIYNETFSVEEVKFCKLHKDDILEGKIYE